MCGWGGGGGEQKQKGGRAGGKGERGTEEGRDIPPQSRVWPRAGKQEVRCPEPRPAGAAPRPPPAPGVPRGPSLWLALAARRIVRSLPGVALPTLFVCSACA